MLSELPLAVNVDPDTGTWSVDDFPMILLPRHYWAAIMEAVESRCGEQETAQIYFDATYRSAYVWCQQEALTHQLTGVAVFHHYMRRMSERGWGRFSVASVDPISGQAHVVLAHSAIALARPDAGRATCHSFNGALCGSMEYVAESAGRTLSLHAVETECLANGDARCSFHLGPKSAQANKAEPR